MSVRNTKVRKKARNILKQDRKAVGFGSSKAEKARLEKEAETLKKMKRYVREGKDAKLKEKYQKLIPLMEARQKRRSR